jgi:purine-binding chemotaxis protein CheW
MGHDWIARSPDDGAEPEGAAARLLRARARLLAQTPDEGGEAAGTEVLLFRLRGEEYAVELRLLRSLRRAAGLTPLPCTPAHVAGILNVHGEVITVLDLAVALGLPGAPAAAEGAHVALVESPHGPVGLLIDEVIGVRRLDFDALDRPLAGAGAVRGIAGARVAVLDLECLLAGGQFEVVEDVA